MVAPLEQKAATSPGLLLLGAWAVLLLPLLRLECLALRNLYRDGVPFPCRTHLCPILQACDRHRLLGTAVAKQDMGFCFIRAQDFVGKFCSGCGPFIFLLPVGDLTHAPQGPTSTSCFRLSLGPWWVLSQSVLTARSPWTPSVTHLGAWDGPGRGEEGVVSERLGLLLTLPGNQSSLHPGSWNLKRHLFARFTPFIVSFSSWRKTTWGGILLPVLGVGGFPQHWLLCSVFLLGR